MLISFFKKLKLRLQFTGWLQYMLTVVFAVLFFLIAAIVWLLGGNKMSSGVALVGIFLLIAFIFDVITVKFNIRPKEKLSMRNDQLDVGISLQKIVIDATRMGIATCWIGPGASQESIIGHLGERFDSEKDHIVCVCAVGYKSNFIPLSLRLMSVIQHKRLPLSSLFFANPQFNTPLNLNEEPFKAFARAYEVCQWSPSSFNGQTTCCVGVVEEQARAERLDEKLLSSLRFDFYTTKESRFYAPIALGIWCANWQMGCEALGILGHFEMLSDEKIGGYQTKNIPLYDISWLLNM